MHLLSRPLLQGGEESIAAVSTSLLPHFFSVFLVSFFSLFLPYLTYTRLWSRDSSALSTSFLVVPLSHQSSRRLPLGYPLLFSLSFYPLQFSNQHELYPVLFHSCHAELYSYLAGLYSSTQSTVLSDFLSFPLITKESAKVITTIKTVGD